MDKATMKTDIYLQNLWKHTWHQLCYLLLAYFQAEQMVETFWLIGFFLTENDDLKDKNQVKFSLRYFLNL